MVQTIKRVKRPSKLKRAHSLGYRAKQGFVIVKVGIGKGGRRREKIRKGRRPKRTGLVHFTTSQSLQALAEKRAARKFRNMEVLNSYLAEEDGQRKYFEVIMVDPGHPVIQSDKRISWICHTRSRAFRGLTSAGRKSRGL